jgi:hypothetical protein
VSYGDSSWWAVHLETRLFYLPAGPVPPVFVVMLFSWLFIPMRRYLLAVRVRVKIGQRIKTFWGRSKLSRKPEIFGPRFSALALACAIGLALFFALYPYFSGLNPDGKHVGIDLPNYERMLLDMEDAAGSNAVSYAFFNLTDRPLGVLFMFGMHKTTGFSSLTVLKFMPLLLGPSLILAMFYFVLEATGDWTVSSLAALLAAFSSPVTVGMLGALFSNWIALVEVYAFSGLIMRSMRKHSWVFAFLSGATLVSVLFTHAYTWAILMGVLGVYGLLLLVSGLRGKDTGWKAKAVVAIIVGNLVMDFLKNWLLGSVGVAREVVHVVQSGLALEFLEQFWSNLNWTLQKTMGGFYMNPLILFLALFGAFLVCLRDRPVDRYLVSWLVLSSVLFIFGSHNVQWRILYNLPITIFAAFGLDRVRRWLQSIDGREAKILVYLCILLVLLMNANYGFCCAYHILEAFVFN